MLTDYDNPRVIGIDVTSSMIHLAVIHSAAPDTVDGYSFSVTTQPPYSLYNTHHHVSAAVSQVVKQITENGTLPALAVCSKFMWRDMKTDPSAARRAAVHTMLLAELHRLRVPVTEFPLPTALRWATGSGAGKAGGMLPELDEEARTRLTMNVQGTHDKYRVSTAILAAIGAMSIGMELSGFKTTDARLSVAAGYESPKSRKRDNRSINWTSRRVPPRSVDEWSKRHEDIAGWLRQGDEKAALNTEGAA
ncbi:hypothetical protein [Mycolicibacterium fallax]|uniref:hypothetical protein n=1 Tax=Mycolicibacterium fallax TaxID=1793 RepID=UPI001056A167|nr:hypothetical protein [Mycolicibacterium fallax]BBY99629.1 hypothetical protein MFAL_30960 [Mycolicibacterium fallax]